MNPYHAQHLNVQNSHTKNDGAIDLTRHKKDTGIQYRHQAKDEIKGFIPKLVARPEYGMVYQHQSMLLQNLHR